MIANFFNKSKPVTIFAIILLLLVYYVSSTFLYKYESFSFFFVIKTVGFFLVFLALLFIMKFIIQKNNLTQDNSFALLLAVLLLGTFYETMFSNNIVFANITLLFAFRKLYSLKSGMNTKQKLFDAGFWVGIATLIYSWSILYVLLIYVAMLIYKRLNFKNIFIPLVGLGAPLFLYFTYCFYFDNLIAFNNCWQFASSFNYNSYNQFKYLIPITFLVTLFLWSVVSLSSKVVKRGVNYKRSFNLVFSHLLISAVIVALAPIKNGSEMFFAIFPLVIFISNFLEKSKSENFKNLILYLFFIISVGVYFL
jgi:hypothetical protein